MNPAPSEKKKSPPRRWRYVWLPLLLLVLGGGCYLLVGFSVHLPPVRPIDRLNEAEAKWEAHGIKNYRLNLLFLQFSRVWITVQDELVVRIEEVPFLCGGLDDCMTYNPAIVTPVAPDNASYTGVVTTGYAPGKTYLPRLDNYTMAGIFEFAAEKIRDEPAPPLFALCQSSFASESRFKVSYDESTGYINSLRQTNCTEWQFGGGLMCESFTTHCQTGFRIDTLEPLPESAP